MLFQENPSISFCANVYTYNIQSIFNLPVHQTPLKCSDACFWQVCWRWTASTSLPMMRSSSTTESWRPIRCWSSSTMWVIIIIIDHTPKHHWLLTERFFCQVIEEPVEIISNDRELKGFHNIEEDIKLMGFFKSENSSR